MNRSTMVAVAMAALLMLAISACGSADEEEGPGIVAPVETRQANAADGEGDPSSPFIPGAPGEAIAPDTTIATVNTEEIKRGEFDARFAQASTSYAMQGVDITDPEVIGELEQQVLQQLINEVLVLQAAEGQGISADQVEVDQEFDRIAAGFESEAEFEAQLEAANLTADRLRQNIADGMLIEAYIDDYIAKNVAPEETEVSDDEIVELYEVYSQQFEDIPPLDEVRPALEDQLHEQKIRTVVSDLLQELAAGSEIEILM